MSNILLVFCIIFSSTKHGVVIHIFDIRNISLDTREYLINVHIHVNVALFGITPNIETVTGRAPNVSALHFSHGKPRCYTRGTLVRSDLYTVTVVSSDIDWRQTHVSIDPSREIKQPV